MQIFEKWVSLHPLLAHKFLTETQFYWKVWPPPLSNSWIRPCLKNVVYFNLYLAYWHVVSCQPLFYYRQDVWFTIKVPFQSLSSQWSRLHQISVCFFNENYIITPDLSIKQSVVDFCLRKKSIVNVEQYSAYRYCKC